MIGAKEKNKAWVRVWVYWVIIERLSDRVNRDSVEVMFQAVRIASSRALRWECALHIEGQYGDHHGWNGVSKGLGSLYLSGKQIT